ncbi:hypothetical protein lerEdw1_003240 [Lerista edwardsae]|nr:hypothetical protein lerEdw1_003240 [Lerista edwardsae]
MISQVRLTRMVQLSHLEGKGKKKTDSTISSIPNSHSIPTKYIEPQSDNLWERDTKQFESQTPITMAQSFTVTRDAHSVALENYCISFSCFKDQEMLFESNKPEANIKHEVSPSERCHALVSENQSIVTKDCVFYHPHNYSSQSKTIHTGEASECHLSRHPGSSKEKDYGKDSATRTGPKLCPNKTESSELKPDHNASVKNINIDLTNADLGSSLQNQVLEGNSVANTVLPVPDVLMDPEQLESSICNTVDFRKMKNVAILEPAESNITEAVPVIHLTISEYERPLIQASRHSIQRKSTHPGTSSNLSHSFNTFGQKDKDRCKGNSNRTKSSAKTKIGTKMPEDFIILGRSSIQHHHHKTKNLFSHSLEQICEQVGISSRLQKKHQQQEKCNYDHNNNQKSPKQVLPCIPKTSISLEKNITSFSVRQAQSSVDFMDLKYSDMFKEINSQDNGPGIYEMFGTPAYTQVREPNDHETSCCRNVHSAPAGRLGALKHKSIRLREQKSCRDRNVQKKTHPKSSKNSPVIKQKQKDAEPKEVSESEDSSPQLNEDALMLRSDGKVKITGCSELFHGAAAQQHLLSPELTCSAKQSEVIPNSNLSTIEEISLEHTSDVGDALVNKALATKEMLWPEVKDHAEYAPFLSNTGEYKCPENCNNSVQGRIEPTDCLINLEVGQNDQELSSSLSVWKGINCPAPQNIQHEHVVLENTSTKWICHPISPFSQTFQDILSHADNEEITEDFFCSLVAELLSLGGVDANGSKGADAETRSESTVNEPASAVNDNKNFCPGFMESSKEHRLETEKNLTNADPVLWTKGEILGKGAYGTVYCGLTSQGQLIAVKQVALDTCNQIGTEKEYQKLQEEVEILKTLKHSNIVGYLGTGLEDNIVSIFMEFVPGGSISSIINRFGPLPETVFHKYTKQILQGVAYLHEKHVIHRDIKGNNVMLMPSGVIKLIDFGCAKRLVCLSLADAQSEPLKSVHGTPYWMAPEVINESGYGRKSDIWSIGCTIFEMATGKPPLASMDKIAAMFYIGAHRGLMPSLPNHCSRKAADFVHVCLTRDQCQRPTALQLLQHPFMKESP